jgi:DNA invertase Pin-like site-specific DNA recombinase
MVSQTPTTSLSPRVRVIPATIRTGRNDENPGGTKKRIAAYARVSTLMEHQTSSYEMQVSYYTEYIQKNPNWEFIKVYTDEGISGTSIKNRLGFIEMIEDAKAGKIDYIVTKSISRFARNTLDCLSYVRLLKNLDKPVGVFFEKENLDTLDSKSELFLTILSSMAQEESKSLSLNTTWGVMKRFSQGKPHIPTTYFLGYDTDKNGNIVIDEEQAKTVRRIFREFLEGKGTGRIAKGLMQDGVLTGRGKKIWTPDSVAKVLRNEKFQGDTVAQKTVTIDFLSHKRVLNKDHKPKYYIQNTHPAIISKEDWNAVQKELTRRGEMLRDPDNKYRMNYSSIAPFSNKLYCGACERPAIRRRLTSKNKGEKYKFTAWQCRVAAHKHCDDELVCTRKYIWETVLEKEFMKLLLKMNNDRANIIQEVENVCSIYDLSTAEKEKLRELEVRLENIADRISILATRESMTSDPVYDATMRHMIYEQEIVQMEYESLSKMDSESKYLNIQLQELFECLDSLKPEDGFRADILGKTVEKGILHEDYRVEFCFKCGVKRDVFGYSGRYL